MTARGPRWNYWEGNRAEVEQLGDAVPLFRIQSRTPAIKDGRKKPLWVRYEERRQAEEQQQSISSSSTRRPPSPPPSPPPAITESEGYLALDVGQTLVKETPEPDYALGDFSSILKYLQSEREKLNIRDSALNAFADPNSDAVKVQVLEPQLQGPTNGGVASQTAAGPHAHKPSTLSREFIPSPPAPPLFDDNSALTSSSRATTPRGGRTSRSPSEPTEAASSPGGRRRQVHKSSSFTRTRKLSRNHSSSSSVATTTPAAQASRPVLSQHDALSPAEQRAWLTSPESTRSTTTTNFSSLFDTDAPTDATLDTDLDLLSLASNSARNSVDPAFFRNPPQALSQLSANNSGHTPVTAVPPRLQPKTNFTQAAAPNTPSRPVPLQPSISDSALGQVRASPPKQKRFAKTSDRILSLLKKLQQDFPHDMHARTLFPNSRGQQQQRTTADADSEDPSSCWSFIDNSNIIVGFTDYLRAHPELAAMASNPKKPKIDYHSLFAILERGRTAKRKVLVGSSPLQQNLDVAEDWFYEVHILSRVLKPAAKVQKRNRLADATNAPVRNPADLSTTDSGSGADDSDSGSGEPSFYFRPNNHRNRRRHQERSSSIRKTQQEQAVDEVLQVRMYEALFSSRDPQESLQGTTLVLASGDGAASEFSPSGFLGPVRAALNAGCSVEIVSWADGVSSVWKQECQRWPGACKIIYLDRYIDELLE